ncbi:MAG: hypothetical protein P8O79_08170 [Halieaceae bacterium]|nr:hypothetical protein [Halieaceae bacterium]
MQLERVVAKDIRSAFDEVKERFGQDVLVVSNQKVGRSVELIVAVDIASSDAANEPAATPAPTAASGMTQVAFEEALKQVADRVGATPQPVDSGLPSETDDAFDAQRLRELTALIKGEFAALRHEVNLAQRLAQVQGSEQYSSMLMDELYASGFPVALGHLLNNELEDSSDLAVGLEQLQTLLTQSLAPSQPIELGGIHWVMGAAGAGKSTMAARLVHSAVNEFGEDGVILISFCDRKGGSWGQTQMTAAGAGVVAYRAQTVDSLKALLDELAGTRCVVLDTGTQLSAEELAYIGVGTALQQVHWVLAADVSEYAARHQITRNEIAIDNVCVSRMDSGTLAWPLIAALIDTQLPVCAYSEGIQVRTGLVNCTSEAWVAKLVGQFAQVLESTLVQANVMQKNSFAMDTLRS